MVFKEHGRFYVPLIVGILFHKISEISLFKRGKENLMFRVGEGALWIYLRAFV